MERQRFINGYKLVYKPGHPKAMTSENWNGWLYEHIYIYEELTGISIPEGFTVHHIDCDRSNNSRGNLVMMTESDHNILHSHMNRAFEDESLKMNWVNSGKPKFKPCDICDRICDEIGRRFCRLCLNNRRSEINSILKLEHSKRSAIQTGQENRPYYEIEELISALIDNRFNFVKTGIALNLSDNGVRKRLKARGLDKAILSQAKSLLLEGATTTGEVMDFLITRLAPDT